MNKSEQSPAGAAFTGEFLWAAILLVIGGVGLALTGAGCSTNKPNPSKFAFVDIYGHSPIQIRDAAAEIFRDNDYRVIPSKTNFSLVCEKQGSKMDEVAYGNWMGEEPIWVRVKVTIVPRAEGAFRIQCLAYKVRDKGSFAFEEELKVARMGRRSYQKMLEQVATSLKGEAGSK
jgi:hypothetical protein